MPLGSCRVPGWSSGSRNQGGDEGDEQGLSPVPDVVDKLGEAKIPGQLLLGDAPVRAQPGAQQRPEALHGVDVDLAEAVAVVVAGVLAPARVNGFVGVAPRLQAGVDVVFVGRLPGVTVASMIGRIVAC